TRCAIRCAHKKRAGVARAGGKRRGAAPAVSRHPRSACKRGAHPMTALAICHTPFPALKDSDTVVDAAGRLIGMFKLTHLLGTLLPKAATIGGISDLAFVGDTLDYLRDRMRAVEAKPIRAYISEAEHVFHPETSPMEVALLLYRGERAVPVVDAGD